MGTHPESQGLHHPEDQLQDFALAGQLARSAYDPAADIGVSVALSSDEALEAERARLHSWALATEQILQAEVLPANFPIYAKVAYIGRMLQYDDRLSRITGDERPPEEKPIEYYQDRLRSLSKQYSKIRR